jgi:hypothetical protein
VVSYSIPSDKSGEKKKEIHSIIYKATSGDDLRRNTEPETS